jgi:hypothetical protein
MASGRRLLRALLPLLLAGLGLLILAVGATAAPPETVIYNPMVADVISQVTTPTLVYELEGLTGERPVTVAGISYTIATRNVLQIEAISMATRYAYEWLAGTGLDVSYHDYSWGDTEGRNVVAEKPGLVDPGEIYLITAHLDDMPPGPRAPGADDNASGSVAVMMAARLLAAHHFAYTVRFVLFTGEEYGLLGSSAYAADCAARGENIRGVINLDMIGYNTGRPVYEIFALEGDSATAAESRQLAGLFVDVASVYDLDLEPQELVMDVYPLVGGSDQWGFLQVGYGLELLRRSHPCVDSHACSPGTRPARRWRGPPFRHGLRFAYGPVDLACCRRRFLARISLHLHCCDG